MQKRDVISISTEDPPVSIYPALMTHSIAIVQAEKVDLDDQNESKLVDEIQAAINPSFWPNVASKCAEGGISARNYLALTSAPLTPEVIDPVLKELNVSEETSVFLRSPTVSLDGGRTEQVVYALIVFKDKNPRIIVSDKEPLISETAIDISEHGEAPKVDIALTILMSICALAGGGLCSVLFGHLFGSGTAEAVGFIIGLVLGVICGILFYVLFLFIKPGSTKSEEPGNE